MPLKLCATCPTKATATFCPRCLKAYDRWRRSKANDGSTAALVQWVSSRLRREIESAALDTKVDYW